MLSHIRVLDLTDGGAAIAGQILAQLGAEVILIEPRGGVASRHVGPWADDVEDPEKSLEFWAAHRGKRSVELALDTDAGRAELAALAAKNKDMLCLDDEVVNEPEKYFDRVVEIDLSTLEPHVVGPHSPDRALLLLRHILPTLNTTW